MFVTIAYWIVGSTFVIYEIDLIFLLITSWIARLFKYNLESEEKYFISFSKQDKPDKKSNCDDEIGGKLVNQELYPKVLIQLPMYNEEEYYENVIETCCNLDWPVYVIYPIKIVSF